MKKITSNNGINKLITHINGECSFDERESNRIKKMIKDDPSSSDIYILRDYIYKKLLNSGKSILELEKVLSNEDMKKRERILNTYKTILKGVKNEFVDASSTDSSNNIIELNGVNSKLIIIEK